MPDQPWRIRITPAEVTIEPSPLGLGHASGEQAEAAGTSPAVDESEDIVL
jgi:hypothetical protein